MLGRSSEALGVLFFGSDRFPEPTTRKSTWEVNLFLTMGHPLVDMTPLDCPHIAAPLAFAGRMPPGTIKKLPLHATALEYGSDVETNLG